MLTIDEIDVFDFDIEFDVLFDSFGEGFFGLVVGVFSKFFDL